MLRLAAASAITIVALTAAVPALADDPVPGLVAAYSFDEGSGSVLNDSSGNGHVGTISGASWASGRYGGALSFNGSNAHVLLGSLGTFYQQAFTLEAWVNKTTASKNDVAVLGSWAGSGPMLWVDHLASRYHLTLGGSYGNYLDSGVSPTAGQWQHLAASYDGTTARFYLNGTQVASRAYADSVGNSNTWRIGAYGATPGGFFDGLIDDVRIYNRALTATEIQTDRDTPLQIPTTPTDVTPPSAPGTLTVSVLPTKATLSWGAATDDVGVVRFNVHRSTSSGFAPSAANRIAQPTSASYTDAPLGAGTYYYKVTAEDAAGNVGPASNQASGDVPPPDTTPPAVAVGPPAPGATLSGVATIAATATDQWGVSGVQFRVDGVALGAEDTSAPYSVAWDTRGAVNGGHTLTAVARDTAGNTTTSAAVAVTVANAGVSSAGLRLAYALNEGSGTAAGDSSGNEANGTLAGGAGWGVGKFGGAVSLNGTSGELDPPALGTFYRSAFTYEAWVYKDSSKTDVGVLGSWTGSAGGAMIWVDHLAGHYRLTFGTALSDYLDSGVSPAVGRWQHLAATYDGTTARFYVDGVQTASKTFTGEVGTANSWRIGAYGATPAGFFDGRIDNVRVYDRALSAGEVATDMASAIQTEQVPPTVVAVTPAGGATGVGVDTAVTAKFSEAMLAASITGATFELRGPGTTLVPATVSYNATTKIATLTPTGALQFGVLYRATLKAGGPKDLAGNALASDVTWTFSTDTAAPPILVVGSTTNKFGLYLTEILENEGLNAYTTVDIAFVTPALLSQFDVVLLGQTMLTPTQETTLTNWVNAGGNLIAMRPDKQLAGLFGLTPVSGTYANAYIGVDTASAPGAGIVGATMQFHGTADRYTLNGATSIATLYSNATTATLNPAVTLRAVGTAGGAAAAFTYDLARSVVYTRQGNPAWAGQERDGVAGIRSSDLFYSSWLNVNKIAIPQADEQQRLLVNLITLMERDRLPLPHFWYLPRGEKAAVVMSGDDHSPGQAPGGTVANFDGFKQLSPPGCVVANWDCVRATSYVYPDSVITNAQAAAYVAEGFEVALHPLVASCPTSPMSDSALDAYFTDQLAAFGAKYTSVPAPSSSRTHCVFWPSWVGAARVELAHGIRMDANYYHFPGSWIGARNGFMTGGGFPMRFADTDGALIDVYQAHTHLTDESTTAYSSAIATLLDNAVGPQGYYGAFGMNMHTDNPSLHPGAQAIVQAAQARGVPVISYKQLLDWTDGRNGSALGGLSWSAGTLTFKTSVAAGANGLQTLLPTAGPTGTLTGLSCGGSPKAYSVQTIKGVEYAVFDAVAGTCQATYG